MQMSISNVKIRTLCSANMIETKAWGVNAVKKRKINLDCSKKNLTLLFTLLGLLVMRVIRYSNRVRFPKSIGFYPGVDHTNL